MSRRPRLRRLRPAVVGLTLAAAALAGCGSSTDAPPAGSSPSAATAAGGGTTTGDASSTGRAPATGTTGNVTVTGASVVVGDPDAARRVRVYQDLNCPHCQALHGAMAGDTAQWATGRDVAVEYTVVDYLGPRTTHGFSTRGANLLALVADVDPAAWPAVQDALLALQPTSTTAQVGDEELLAAARAAGADLEEDATEAQRTLAYTDWVQAATADAAAAGVSYIPQVWIDGTLVEGASHEETAQLVREAVTD